MSDSHLIKRGTKVITKKNLLVFFTIFNLQTLSDRIVLIVRQMTVLAWQMTANLWTEAVHSSWQIIHQKWKIALRSPCDNHHPFQMKWPIGVCNNTIMHRSDWGMVSELIFGIRKIFGDTKWLSERGLVWYTWNLEIFEVFIKINIFYELRQNYLVYQVWFAKISII